MTMRAGLSLLEVVVTVAIVAVLGGVLFSNMSGDDDRQRVNESIVVLKELGVAIYRMDSATNRFPRRISHLHTPITSTETNICGIVYNTKGKNDEVGAWQADARGGPFYPYPTPETGFPIPIGTVSDTLTRSPATAANEDQSFAVIQIVVRSVSDDDVTETNLIVDRDGSSTGGAVRWTSTGGGLNTMTWNIPVAGC